MPHPVAHRAAPLTSAKPCLECARKKPVIVVDYDPKWPAQFRSLHGRIAGALRLIATAVEHIGSTAVPGLAAKPILDIDVLLASAALLPDAIARLATLGYVHQGDLGIPGREAFRSPPGGPAHHLYVCPPHSQEFRRHLALRSYLRNHPDQAAQYAALKKALAARFAGDREAYIAGKSEFVAELTQRAIAAKRKGLTGPQLNDPAL